jgi:hypothetical protein
MGFSALYFYHYNVMVQRVYYWQVTYFDIFIMGYRYLCGIVLVSFVYFVKCFTGGCVNLSEVFNMGQRVLVYLCERITFYIICT